MQENTKVDKEYKEAFNQGYELSKELGLKPDILKDIHAGNNRIQAMKEGMEQYAKDIELNKDKQIIPPLDLDNIETPYINLDSHDKSKNKDKGIDMDM